MINFKIFYWSDHHADACCWYGSWEFRFTYNKLIGIYMFPWCTKALFCCTFQELVLGKFPYLIYRKLLVFMNSQEQSEYDFDCNCWNASHAWFLRLGHHFTCWLFLHKWNTGSPWRLKIWEKSLTSKIILLRIVGVLATWTSKNCFTTLCKLAVPAFSCHMFDTLVAIFTVLYHTASSFVWE